MSKVRWIGNALAVAQVDTITVGGTWSANETIDLTVNGKTVSFVVGDTVIANIVTNVIALINAATLAELKEVTAGNATSTTFTLTAQIPGNPFTITVGVTSGSGTASSSGTVTSDGPNYWSTAANWDTGSVPVSTDDVYIEDTAVPILYGLSQSAVTLNSLNISASFTGTIGLPDYNTSRVTGGYYEYRTKTLAISATTVKIGYGVGNGSTLIRFNTGTNATTLSVYNTAATATGAQAVMWKGVHASNKVEVLKGNVGIATVAGDLATTGLNIGYVSSPDTDATVVCGPGTTISGTVKKTGGTLTVNSSVDTLSQTAGSAWFMAGDVTLFKIDGGTVYYNSQGGTVTDCTIAGKGKLDLSQDLTAKTFTNPISMYAGASLSDPQWVGGESFQLIGCSLSDVTIDQGPDRTYTVT